MAITQHGISSLPTISNIMFIIKQNKLIIFRRKILTRMNLKRRRYTRTFGDFYQPLSRGIGFSLRTSVVFVLSGVGGGPWRSCHTFRGTVRCRRIQIPRGREDAEDRDHVTSGRDCHHGTRCELYDCIRRNLLVCVLVKRTSIVTWARWCLPFPASTSLISIGRYRSY